MNVNLLGLVCNQFFRGVFVMMGSMNSDSFQTFYSYGNTFHMPIVTPLNPIKKPSLLFEVSGVNQIGI